MINKQFQDLVSRAFKGNSLPEREFWEELQDRKNLQYFAKKIIQSIRGHNTRSKFSLQVLNTTLGVLVLNLSARGSMQNLKQGFELNLLDLLSQKSQSSPNSQWIFKIFCQAQDHNYINQLLLRIAGLQKNNVQDSLIRNGAYTRNCRACEQDEVLSVLDTGPKVVMNSQMSFGVLKIRHFLNVKSWELEESTITDLTSVISDLVKAYQAHQDVVIPVLFQILWIIKYLLRSSSLPSRQKLKDLLYLLDVVRRLPGALGRMGDELLHLLLNEMKLAGYAFRQSIVSNLHKLKIQSIKEVVRQIYMISCGQCEDQEFKSSELQDEKTNHFIRLMMCVNMVSIKQRQTTDRLSKLASLSVKDIFDIYRKLVQILDKIIILDSCQDISRTYEKAIREILSVIDKVSEEVVEIPQNFYDQISNNLAGCMFRYPKPIVIPIIPNTRELNSNAPQFTKAIEEIYLKLLSDKSWSEPAEFLVTGDTIQINRLIRAVKQISARVSHKSVRIFYIPRGQFNLFGRFLGSLDPVFAQQIYLTFSREMHIPKSVVSKRSIEGSYLMKLKHQLLDNYISHATNQLDLFCTPFWINSKDKQIFYFFHYCQIYPAKILNFPMMGLQKQWPLAYTDNFRPVSFQVQIEIKSCGLDGSFGKVERIQLYVIDIRIARLPLPFWLGNPPQINSKYFQVSILPYDNFDAMITGLKKLAKYRKYDSCQVLEAFKGLWIKLRGSEMRIKGLNYPLNINYDGQQMTNANQVQFGEGEWSKTSVMTFVPMG